MVVVVVVFQKCLLYFQCLYFTCMETTCEKMASGTANRTDSSQIETAFRHVQKTALDVWMSIGFTIALYLMETGRETSRWQISMLMSQKSKSTPKFTQIQWWVDPRIEPINMNWLNAGVTRPLYWPKTILFRQWVSTGVLFLVAKFLTC